MSSEEDSSESGSIDTDTEHYEIENVVKAIVDWKKGNKVFWKYFVKWKGYHEDENTWEPPGSFDNPKTLRSFWESIKTGGRDKDDGRLWRIGEEVFPGIPFHRSNDEDERTYWKRKKMREARKELRHHRRSPSLGDEELVVRKRKRHISNGITSKSRPLHVTGTPTESSDDRPLDSLRHNKGKSKATQSVSRSRHVGGTHKSKKPYVSDSEPSTDPETGLYKTSLKRPRHSAGASTDSDHAGPLFSDDSAPNSRAGSVVSSRSAHLPNRVLSAAERAELQRRQDEAEARRNKIPAHIARKQHPRVKMIDILNQPPTENGQVGFTISPTALASQGQAQNTTANIVADSVNRVQAQQTPLSFISSPKGHSLIVPMKKGGLGVARTVRGHFVEARPISRRRPTMEHVSESPEPRSVRGSPAPDIRTDAPTAVINDLPMDVGDTFTAGNAMSTMPATMEPEPMDVMDQFMVFPSDPPPSSETHEPSPRTQIAELPPPAMVLEDDPQEDVLENFIPPQSTPDKLFLQYEEESPYSYKSAGSTPSNKDSSDSNMFSPNKATGALAVSYLGDSPLEDNSRSLTEYAQLGDTSLQSLLTENVKKAQKKGIVMPLQLGPSSKLSIVLQDVQPPTLKALHDFSMLIRQGAELVSVGFQQNGGLPGKIYPYEVLETLKPQNLCARVILPDDVSDQQTQHFEKLVAALERKKVFIYTLPRKAGASLFVLCSSQDEDAARKLGIPDALIGLERGVIIETFAIKDEMSYLTRALDAEDLQLR